MKSQRPILEIKNLVTRFGSQIVHDHLHLSVNKGEVVGVVGGSGAGKSVLLGTILGLLRPASGSVFVDGINVWEATDDQKDMLHRLWGVLFQDGALFSGLTVLQNVTVPMKVLTALPEAFCQDLALFKLSQVGLSALDAAKYPQQLSGGMRKRVGIARALALDPALLFLDEPTAGLDPIAAAEFDALIQMLHETLNLTIIMVSHDLDSLRNLCTRLAVLVHKKIVSGTLQDMLQNKDPWIHSYFHGQRAQLAFETPTRISTEYED